MSYTGFLKRLNFNLFYFGLIIVRPPLFVIIGLAAVFAIASFFISKALFISSLIVLGLFVLSFLSIIAIKGKDIRFFSSFLLLPLFMFRQLLALFKIKRARTAFLKTEHTKVVYINDVIKS